MSADTDARRRWHAVVLAASRPGDPLCRAFGIAHKCLLPVAGEPMLARVVRSLARHPAFERILVVIEDDVPLAPALGSLVRRVEIVPARKTITGSVDAAMDVIGNDHPVLITTAGHALLDKAMIEHFLVASEASGGDVTAGLVRAEVVLKHYPRSERTVLAFGPDRVCGGNLYAILTPEGRRAIDFWEGIEANHQQPLKLAMAFGLTPLIRFLTGTLNLDVAFQLASHRIGINARPVFMPMPEAAIDIDRPEDKALVDEILTRR